MEHLHVAVPWNGILKSLPDAKMLILVTPCNMIRAAQRNIPYQAAHADECQSDEQSIVIATLLEPKEQPPSCSAENFSTSCFSQVKICYPSHNYSTKDSRDQKMSSLSSLITCWQPLSKAWVLSGAGD